MKSIRARPSQQDNVQARSIASALAAMLRAAIAMAAVKTLLRQCIRQCICFRVHLNRSTLNLPLLQHNTSSHTCTSAPSQVEQLQPSQC